MLMIRYCIIAVVASLIGLKSFILGLGLLWYADSTQAILQSAHMFEKLGITSDAWRSGLKTSSSIFIVFGLAALIAAFGLFRLRLWGRTLWLILAAFLFGISFTGAIHDRETLMWSTASVLLFIVSAIVLRRHPVLN